MSQFYRIIKADPLGDPYTPSFDGAKATQTYWCQVEGEELAVSIGKQVPNTLTAGESVYGDLMKATSQRGTNYWKFKSAKVPDGVARPASTPAQAVAQQSLGMDVSTSVPGWFVPVANQIDFIYNKLKASEVHDVEPESLAPDVPEEPAVVEAVGGEAIDEATQATLNEIFGAPEKSKDE